MAAITPGWLRRLWARGLRFGTPKRGGSIHRQYDTDGNGRLVVEVWSPRLDRTLRHWRRGRLEVWVGAPF